MEKTITIKDAHITDILRRLLRNGSLLDFYISMQGIKADGENLEKATTMGESPAIFVDDAVDKAADDIIRQADVKLKMAISERLGRSFFGNDAYNDPATLEIFENISVVVHKIGFAEIVKRMSFSVHEFIRKEVTEARENEILKILQTLEEKKAHLLPHLLRARTRGKNKYGDLDERPIINELRDFLNAYFPKGSLCFFYRAAPIGIVKAVVMEWLEEIPQAADAPTNGLDFEHWCAENLETMGWSCVVSKASGDQGVDVVATKKDYIVAVQCKRYSNPIGNKAVQEAFAGMRHYGAGFAAVIGTGGFTKSAKELAQNTGVHLIDAANIRHFDALITI